MPAIRCHLVFGEHRPELRKVRGAVEILLVERAQLLGELRARRTLVLDKDTWHATAILAGLRVAANDRLRARDRDRGEAKNWLADLWGVLGELVALRILDEIWGGPVNHHPIDFSRPVDEVDLVAMLSDAPLRLEAKAHMLEPGKAWFLINSRAHQRSRRRGAVGYIPVLSALGAQRAIVGPLLAIEEVDRWGAPDKRLADPAVGVLLSKLCREQLSVNVRQAGEIVRAGDLATRDELHARAGEAGRAIEHWRAKIPPLEALHAREVVQVVISTSQRIHGGR
jgi:hypothetical protein